MKKANDTKKHKAAYESDYVTNRVLTVFGGGIDRMSANGFSREVGMYYEDVHLDETPKVALKRTLGDRIKPDVLEKLKAMRDGA
mgnify:CR=1 FL=1